MTTYQPVPGNSAPGAALQFNFSSDQPFVSSLSVNLSQPPNSITFPVLVPTGYTAAVVGFETTIAVTAVITEVRGDKILNCTFAPPASIPDGGGQSVVCIPFYTSLVGGITYTGGGGASLLGFEVAITGNGIDKILKMNLSQQPFGINFQGASPNISFDDIAATAVIVDGIITITFATAPGTTSVEVAANFTYNSLS